MIEVQIIGRLKDEQVKYAQQALKHPDKRDAFEYGYRVGVLAGLESAIGVITKAIEEENSRDL